MADIYVFGDAIETLTEKIKTLGCKSVVDLVKRELKSYKIDDIKKVLSAIRFVAKRRNMGGRHHLDVLHTYNGSFVKTGMGLKILPDGTEVMVGDL